MLSLVTIPWKTVLEGPSLRSLHERHTPLKQLLTARLLVANVLWTVITVVGPPPESIQAWMFVLCRCTTRCSPVIGTFIRNVSHVVVTLELAILGCLLSWCTLL